MQERRPRLPLIIPKTPTPRNSSLGGLPLFHTDNNLVVAHALTTTTTTTTTRLVAVIPREPGHDFSLDGHLVVLVLKDRRVARFHRGHCWGWIWVRVRVRVRVWLLEQLWGPKSTPKTGDLVQP